MPSSCCVPGCQSNYKSTDSVRVFKFPSKGTSQFEEWMRKIPRKDWTPGPRSVVCIQHFKEADVIKEDAFTMPDGTVCSIPRQRYKLIDNAVPCIFSSLPSYLSDFSSSKPRKNPMMRKEEVLEIQQQQIDKFLSKDLVLSFKELKENLNSVKKDWLLYTKDNCIIFYLLNTQKVPVYVSRSITIQNNLTISVFLENKEISNELTWLCKFNKDKELCLERYSQLENLLSWLENQDVKQDPLQKIIKEFGDCVKLYENNLETFEVLTFLHEQLLLNFSKNVPRYSPKMLSWAFSLYIKSPKCYNEIVSSGILILPKERYLRKISSILSFTGKCDEADHQNYLKSKCQKLPESSRQVNLLIDEITVRPHINFCSDSLLGMSVNKKLKRATSVQSYMISSIYSSDKDVAAMVPVHNSNAQELFEWTKQVIKVVQECGYVIVSIITDNNRVNRNMLTNLCGGSLKTSIPNPTTNGKIFLLFDTVHIIKSIRNNWINQRTSGNTFIFPSISNHEVQLKASFVDLVNLYEKEKGNIVKYAPKLTFKALNPNNFERQNVALCLRIFDDSNIVALKSVNSIDDCNGTIELLETVTKWWKMVNIKNTRKGFEHLNALEMPFSSVDDARLLQLNNIVSWLEMWKDVQLPYKGCRSGKLSEETFCSLIHTTKALRELIIYRLSVLNDEYVLTGKYQTDPIEGRFGEYRQMHGGNYNISVEQVLRAEKKLRLKSLIQMHSSKFGNFQLKKFLIEFSDVNNTETFDIELKGVDFFSHTEEEEAMFPVFIYICGYAAYKLKCKLTCSLCTKLFLTDKEILFELSGEAAQSYFMTIDRGNLTYSDDEIIRLFIVCYKIFTFFLNEENEDFLHSPKIKNILKELVIKKIEELGICSIGECEGCHCSKFEIGLKFIPTFLNIFLNNYSIAKNDSFASAKGSKRKCKALLSSSSEI